MGNNHSSFEDDEINIFLRTAAESTDSAKLLGALTKLATELRDGEEPASPLKALMPEPVAGARHKRMESSKGFLETLIKKLSPATTDQPVNKKRRSVRRRVTKSELEIKRLEEYYLNPPQAAQEILAQLQDILSKEPNIGS